MTRDEAFRGLMEVITAYRLDPRHDGMSISYVTVTELANWAVVWKSEECDAQAPGVVAYRKLIDEWMAARGGVDGDWLSQAGESAWMARADEIWRGLSEEEQDEAERLGKVKVNP